MSVFEKLDEPYVRLGELDSEEWCDDIGFFKRMREAGIQSYCDSTVMCGHMGTVTIEPEWDEENKRWLTVYNTRGTGRIKTPQIQPKLERQIETQQ
jgi:hypothetical protein